MGGEEVAEQSDRKVFGVDLVEHLAWNMRMASNPGQGRGVVGEEVEITAAAVRRGPMPAAVLRK
jgi:hypothetical protein